MIRSRLCWALLLCGLAGCTSSATRQSIAQWERTEQLKQQAMDNALRVANEQMFLSTMLFMQQHPEQAREAAQAAWKARDQLEEMRMQYQLARSLSQLTVGQYLYDQQGWLNVMLEGGSKQLSNVSGAIEKANKAAGVNDPRQLWPSTQPR